MKKRSPVTHFLAIIVAGGSIIVGPLYMMVGLWEQFPKFNPLYIPLIGCALAMLVLIFGPKEKE